MINIKQLKQFSLDEIKAIQDLKELVIEAEDMSKLITGHYNFKCNQDKVIVWSDSCNTEYFHYNGTWEACYLPQHYKIDCSKEGIFALLSAKYYLDNNMFDNDQYGNNRRVYAKACEAYGYFMTFVDNTRKKVEQHE